MVKPWKIIHCWAASAGSHAAAQTIQNWQKCGEMNAQRALNYFTFHLLSKNSHKGMPQIYTCQKLIFWWWWWLYYYDDDNDDLDNVLRLKQLLKTSLADQSWTGLHVEDDHLAMILIILIITWLCSKYDDQHKDIHDINTNEQWWIRPAHRLCWSGPGSVDPLAPGWPPLHQNQPAWRLMSIMMMML